MRIYLSQLLIFLFFVSHYKFGFTQNLIDGKYEESILATANNDGHINTLDSTRRLKYWKSPNQAELSIVEIDKEKYLQFDVRKQVWVKEKVTNHFEYAQVYFFEVLKKDVIYKFSFEMKSSSQATNAHMDLQVYFGKEDIPKRIPTSTTLPVKNQILSEKIVTPALQFNYKKKWQKLDKYYKAKGGERYLIFGIFNDRRIHDTQLLGKKVGVPDNPENSSKIFRNLSLTKAPLSKPEASKPSLKEDVESIESNFENIYFESNSTILTLDSKLVLDKLLDYLNNNPSFNLEITGYTDAVGNENSNQKLSQKRADNAFYYLEKKGLNRARVLRIGRGEVESSNNNEDKAINRRVNFRIIKSN